MLATITPSQLSGTIDSIASKSMAHRLIIAAAMADTKTHVICNTSCADIDATVGCLNSLGAQITKVEDGFEVKPTVKSIKDGILRALSGRTLDCNESGSTYRFMVPVCAALGADAVFTGATRLAERPLSPLSEELEAKGVTLNNLGHFPMDTHGRLQSGTVRLPGNVSSQFITGLLLAAPLLEEELVVEVTGRLESRPYVNLTIKALRAFGVEVKEERTLASNTTQEFTRFTPSGRYRTPGEVRVEGDWSNAAFWLCAGAIGNEPVGVQNLDLASSQGDRAILAILSRFGATTQRGNGVATVKPEKLHGYEISAKDCPDLVPVVAAVASVSNGVTFINDCARLRIKESDRMETVRQELTNLGAQIEIRGDSLIITGKETLEGGEVQSHNDHRIAMMAAVASTRCSGPVTIHQAEAVNKSYPSFFEDFAKLGGTVELSEE